MKRFNRILLALSLLTAIVQVPGAQAAQVITLGDTDALAFVKTNASVIAGGATLANAGKAVNDIVLYKNVGVFGGTAIDAAVTTVAIGSGSISDYDNPGSASTAAGYLNNWQINTVGGEATFKFEFFKAGTYTGVNTGIPVVLQNVKVTSIDLDSSGTNGYQYSDFTGFQKYSMMSPTNLGVQQLSNPNRVRFIATKTGARSSVPEDQVLIRYDNLQTMQVSFGNVVPGQTNYFGLVFGGWPGAGTPVEYPNVFNAPPVSSNTTLTVLDTTTASAFTIVPLSAFGNYSDPDSNPFFQVKIDTVTAGTLQVYNGTTWANVNAGTVISVSDIEKGWLRYDPSGWNGTPEIRFYVHDGLDYSINSYKITLNKVSQGQVISFPDPGTRSLSSGPLVNPATVDSGLTETLTSLTPGVCRIAANGQDIEYLAAGTCSVIATQPGNGTYSAAEPKTITFQIVTGTVGATPQTITFTLPANKPLSGGTFSPLTGDSASSGLDVTLTSLTPDICEVTNPGSVITPKKVGACVIEATQNGDGTYSPATKVTRTVNITESASGGNAPQIQTLGAVVNNSNSTLNGTASSKATLNGYVDLNGVTTVVWKMCYARPSSAPSSSTLILPKTATGYWCVNATPSNTDSSTGTSVTSSDSVSTTLDIVDSNSLNNIQLKYDATYYYQIVGWDATTASDILYGAIMSFKTKTYYIATNAATSVSTTTANLNGYFKNSSSKSTYTAYYCLTDTYKVNAFQVLVNSAGKCDVINNPSSANISKGNSGSPVGSATGLKPGTVYYYQIYVIKSGSKTPSYYGNIVRFRTGDPDPVATTLAPTSLGASSATLNGSVLANSTTDAIVSFCYGTSSTLSGCASVYASPSTVSGMSGKSVSAFVTGLTAGQTYYYRTVAIRGSGSPVYGAIKSFTIGAPTVTTLAPTSVKLSSGVSTWEATLNGFMNPNGTSSNPRFCWGTSPTVNANDSMTVCSTIVITGSQETLTSLASYSFNLTGLTGSTKYYYQAYGVNNVLSPALYNYGEVKSFVTAAEPVVTTLAATGVSSDSATVNGTINPSGALTNGTFCISDSSSNTINTGVLDSCLFLVVSAPDSMTGSSVVNINAIVNGLSQATTYYFQAIGENERGTVYGEILNFTTLAGAPEATTEAPTNIRGTSATLNGFVNPGGAPTQAYFCISNTGTLDNTTGNLATCWAVSDTATVNATAGLMPLTFNKTGLTNNTTYYYQTIALNTVNGVTTTVYGDVVSFRTGVPEVATLPVTDMANPAGNSNTVIATLNGTVASNGDTVTAISFILSTSNLVDSLGSLDTTTVLAATPSTVNGGLATAQSETHAATSLILGTTYFYQIRATNSRGTAYGKVLSFVAYAPVAITRAASSVGSSAATLNGAVNPTYDLAATGKFCLSDSSAVDGTGKLVTCIQLVDGNPGTFPNAADSATANAMLANITGLSAGNTYFFQAIASGTNGTNYGEVLNFTTGYAVTFLANDGTNTSTSQAGTSAAALNTNTFTRSGYTFGGWSLTSGGSVAYTDGASYPFTSNITLYAIWTANTPAQTPVVTPPKTNPTIRWNNPSPINFGTPLSGTQLNSLFSVPGTCVYTPPAGTILAAGTHTLSVTCTPTDGNLYNPMTTTVTIEVKKAKGKPSIIWFNPNPIYNPTPLTGTQLNAAASVLGTYRYDPAEGTILPPGTHILNVHFIPKNQDEEEELDARVTILVKEKPANLPNPNTPVAPPSVKDPEAPKKPVLPPAPTVIPAADAKPVMQTAGVKAETVVIPYEDKSGYVIKAPDWTLGIRSTTQFVQGNANESLSKITIEKGNNVTTSGTGFKPNSQVDLYAFSTPIWLGSTITDALGNFSATVPMPDGLPVGDHTFQVNGLTPDEKTRTAAVPITLVPATVAAPKTGGLNFSIYYKLDSFFLYDADKATIAKYVNAINAKTTPKSKVTVEIIGWVQPTVISPHIQYLSQGRAKAIGNYMRKLGLKATYTFITPGHDKLNVASSRRGEVTVKWTYAK